MKLKSTLTASLTFSLILCNLSLGYANTIKKPKPINQNAFIQRMNQQYHVKPASTLKIIKHIKYNQKVITYITNPAEKRAWAWYRSYFISKKRIQQGLSYWNKHEKTLHYAEHKYGVDPSIIIAIIGIETFYGQNTGHFNTLNALGTLAFYYPPRSRFFSKELANFIVLCQQQTFDITQIKGSYAGALGIPQFMPSSYRHYAVNHDHSNRINLFTNNNDAIVSVANYLYKSGWHKHEPIASLIKNQTGVNPTLISSTNTPKHTVDWYKRHHINTFRKDIMQQKAALIALDNIKSKQYWLIFNNFKAIMSYNPSINYAMAIYQLSEKIKAQHYHG